MQQLRYSLDRLLRWRPLPARSLNHVRGVRALIAAAIILTAAPALPGLAATQVPGDPEKHHVLYINSYMNGYAWSDNILEGLREGFAASGRIVDLQVEYLDTRRYPDPMMRDRIKDLFQLKFQGRRFDAVIVSDNDAFDFALEHGAILFPDTPVIFCGVNDFHPESIAGRDDITGVTENVDVAATLEVALELDPDKRTLVVIGDPSTTSRAIEQQVRSALQGFQDRLELDSRRVAGLDDLREQVSDLPPDAMLFFIPFYLTEDDYTYNAQQVLEMFVAAQTDAPIYSTWEFLLGHGIVGGKLLDGVHHGRVTADIVLRILSGEKPSNIPVQMITDDPFMFDNAVLERLNISPADLPKGSVVINQPQPFYELQKPIFWTIMASLVVLTVSLFFLVLNIHRRRLVEQQVKDQLHFMQLLMNTIPIPIYFREAAGNYGLFNTSFEKWFCTRASEECGGQCLSAACKGLSSLADAADNTLLDAPGVNIYERRVRDVDGRWHDVLVHKATYMNARGDVEGLVGVLYDISDRKRAEESLRASQAMLRSVLDTIPQLVYWKDARCRYLGANRSFAEFFGLDEAGHVVGKENADLMPSPADARRGERMDMEVMLTGNPRYRMLWELERSPGHTVTLEINKVPLVDHNGQVAGVLSTAEDVTAKISLEKQLLQSQKMEAIGTFVSGIAHDFNNILTTIINSSELALLDLSEDGETAGDVRRALTAAQQGSRLVKQIHTYTRPSREGFQPVDMAHLLREALSLVRASLPGTIRLDEKIDEVGECLANPTQLHQVAMNLCTNAFQALQARGGKIEVRLEHTALDAEQASSLGLEPGQYVRLRISDSGPGISPEIKDKIFDPFFTTKGKGEGTGLGLAVVQGIVKGHKGAVTVSSQPGEHTDFEILLPYVAPLELGMAEPEAEETGGHERILFVEDDPDQLTAVPKVLTRLGYDVTACQTPRVALDALRDNGSYDLVVTDFDMPEVSGVEFSRDLHALKPELPVIMVSGRKNAVDAADRVPNIRRVLAKPYSGRALSQAIRNVMGSE